VAVLPADGCADLILLDDELIVAGPSTRALLTRGSAGGAVGVRFAPGLAGRSLGIDPGEIRDRGVSATDVLSRDLRRRAESALRRLAGNADPIANGRAADAMRSLTLPAELGIEFDRAQLMTARMVRAAAGRGHSAEQTAELLGYSVRQFRRRMSSAFGYGYAELRRVSRVHRALAAIRSGASLSEAAQLGGFSDQPHLTREFRVIAGATPAQFSGRGA